MSPHHSRNRRFVFAVSVLIVGAVVACSRASDVTVVPGIPPSPPPPPAPVDSAPGEIAVVGPLIGNDQAIYLITAEGRVINQLTTSGAGVFSDPAWSPDGTQLAIVNATAGGIYIIETNGYSSGVKLTIAGENPTWSPDGSKIAFAMFETDSTGSEPMHTERIGVINADGSGFAWLSGASPLGHRDFSPAWSRDGKRIAFVRGVDERITPTLIYTTSAEGILEGDPAASVPQGSECAESSPAWSPNGRSLLLWSFCAGSASGQPLVGFATRNTDGSGAMTPIISGVPERYNSHPDWSPDGKWIVFNSDGSGSQPMLYVMRADGSRLQRLGVGSKPAWRPRH